MFFVCVGLLELVHGGQVGVVLLPPGLLQLPLVLLPGWLDELLLLLFCQGVPVELDHLLLQGGAGGQSGSSPLPQPEPEPLLLLLPHTQGPGHSLHERSS